MSREPSDHELDSLLGKLRAEPPPARVREVARALPARVDERLRAGQSEEALFGLACLRWTPALAGVAAVCAVLAMLGVRSGELDVLDPQLAGWLVLFFG